MLLSIIVPVYNVEQYLNDCVYSILSQTMANFELILVDDGSSDNSSVLCDEWASKDKRIKAYHKENGGLSDARNFGIEKALGEYLWFVDSDDFIKDNVLREIESCIIDYPTADIIATNIVQYKSGSYSVHGKGLDKGTCLLSPKEFVLQGFSVMPSVRYIIHRRVFDNHNLRFIKGVLHEDIPFCHMLLGIINIIAVSSIETYVYRIRENSITTTNNIASCYSLIESLHKIISFRDNFIKLEHRHWFNILLYDYFYEMFYRMYPFLNTEHYYHFMKLNSLFINREFNNIKCVLKGKRKYLLMIFNISPKLYSMLIHAKRN